MSKRVIGACLLAFLLAPCAYAGKFYIGASAGSSSLQLNSDVNQRINFDSTGYKGFVGYRALRFLAIEAAYTDFGNLDATSGTTSFDGQFDVGALWAVGILPATPKLWLFGRLGYASWDSKATIDNGVDPPQTNDDSGEDVGYGFGIGYNITRKFGVQLEWETYKPADIEDVTFASFGVRWTF